MVSEKAPVSEVLQTTVRKKAEDPALELPLDEQF